MACSEPRRGGQAQGRLITAQLWPFQPGPHHRGRGGFHAASTPLPQAPPAEQMKSVITLDLWLNRRWQRWEVGNAIGLRVCISVSENKSSGERARCGPRAAGTAHSGWLTRLTGCLQWQSGRSERCVSGRPFPRRWPAINSPSTLPRWLHLNKHDGVMMHMTSTTSTKLVSEVGQLWTSTGWYVQAPPSL